MIFRSEPFFSHLLVGSLSRQQVAGQSETIQEQAQTALGNCESSRIRGVSWEASAQIKPRP